MSKSLILLLAVRLGLGLTYSLTVPTWESYDEDGHFAYARYLARRHTLSLTPGDPEAEKVWEKFQPPLYYILVAAWIAAFDLSEAFTEPARNPYLASGNAGVNYALHPASVAGADRETALAVRWGRALGVAISTVSVIFVYRAARRVWPGEEGTVWAAACLYAFWPQFLFVGSMLTNDILVTALSAAALYLVVTLAADGFDLRRTLLLAALLSAALLTKLNALALIPPAAAGVALSLAPYTKPPPRWRPVHLGFGLAGLGLIIAAALWLLNSLEFVTGQVFQAATVADFARNLGLATRPSDSGLIWAAVGYAFRTFLASYGWGNLETYPWLYGVWTLSAALAGLGWLVIIFWRQQARAQFEVFQYPWPSRFAPDKARRGEPHMLSAVAALLVVTSSGMALALAIARQSVFLVPGRYLLPALPAVVILLIGGWRGLLLPAPRLRLPVWKVVCLGLVIVGWLTPVTILAPAYAPPRTLTVEAATIDNPLGFYFGNSIQLVGNREVQPVAPGETLSVDLCWQAATPVTENYSVFLEVVGPDGQGYGRLETYPGRGNYATTLWPVNAPFCDAYSLAVASEIPAPALAHMRVSLLRGVLGPRLPVADPAGELLPDDAVTIPFKVRLDPRSVPALAHAAEYYFGAGIVLNGYDITPLPGSAGEPGVVVTLRWAARSDVLEDYVVFVHLRDTPQTAYAQGDSPPLDGAYPTRLWRAGEALLDEHVLFFPDDAPTPPLDLYVGLYDVNTNKRLVASDAQGSPLPNAEVILARRLVFP